MDSHSSPTLDAQLVIRAREGDSNALDELLRRYQSWIYNLALRMVWSPEEAQDVTQEVLVKVVTSLSQFRSQSQFRTWLYRIVANHVLGMKRRGGELAITSFKQYGSAINATPDDVLPDPRTVPVDPSILENESKLACVSGMLLCLDRKQRLVFILGAMLGVSDEVGADILETSKANFRQLLSRARKDLRNFMMGQCGLVDPRNPCRCAKKTKGYIRAGIVDPKKLRFHRTHIRSVNQVVGRKADELEDWLSAFGEQPFYDPPDLVGAIRRALQAPRRD